MGMSINPLEPLLKLVLKAQVNMVIEGFLDNDFAGLPVCLSDNAINGTLLYF